MNLKCGLYIRFSLQKKESLPRATTWTSPGDIVLRGAGRPQTDKHRGATPARGPRRPPCRRRVAPGCGAGVRVQSPGCVRPGPAVHFLLAVKDAALLPYMFPTGQSAGHPCSLPLGGEAEGGVNGAVRHLPSRCPLPRFKGSTRQARKPGSAGAYSRPVRPVQPERKSSVEGDMAMDNQRSPLNLSLNLVGHGHRDIVHPSGRCLLLPGESPDSTCGWQTRAHPHPLPWCTRPP